MLIGRVVRLIPLEHQLILLAEIDLLQVLALGQVPEVQAPAVFAAEQDLGNEAVFNGVGSPPFAGDHGVVAEMPPGVIGELLRPAIDLPAPERLEAFVVHDKDAARTLALGAAGRRDLGGGPTALGGSRSGVS